MKIKISVLFFLILLLVGCEKEEFSFNDPENGYAGLKSEFTYEYLPYSADSAQVVFYIDTIGGDIIPCNQVQLLLADSVINEVDSIPTSITCRIPLIDDCIFEFVHRCYIDSVYCSAQMLVSVHKGEIVTPNHFITEFKFPYKYEIK